MALTGLEMLLRNTDNIGFKLIPHIEEAALKYVFRTYAMASRVSIKTDMSGWNARKISEYLPSRRAGELSEDTAIPNTTLVRVRKADVEPKEVGERYRISDRRTSTDLEDIVADVIEALGKSIGDKVEQDLQDAARSFFRGGTIGTGVADLALADMLTAAVLFRSRARRGQLFAVIHPFQGLPIMQDLIDYAGAQTSLPFRDDATTRLSNQSVTEFDLPTFGGLNLTTGEYVPRRATFQFKLYGTAGTFRLQVGDGYDTVTPFNITAAITATTVAATLLTNIQTALNALDMSPYYSGALTWVVTGSDILDMTITPPADFYIDDQSQLRVAVQYDDATKASLWGGDFGINLQKSGYDLVTTITSAPTDMNGNDLGVEVLERTGATARALFFQREALIFDIRAAIKSHFDNNLNQGRTAEYSGFMVYGVDQWSPEVGLFIHTKADHPQAV